MRAGRTPARTERPMAERFARRDQESTCRSDEARGDPGHNPDTRCAGLSAARWAGTFASLYRRFHTPLQPTGKPHASVELGMAGIPLGPSICTVGECPWSADCSVLVVMVIAKYLQG